MTQQRLWLVVPLLAGLCAYHGIGADEPSKAQGGGVKKSDSVARAAVTADKPDADGKQVLTVSLTIDKSWHLYANPVPKDFPGIPTSITIEAKSKPQEVKIDYPPGKLIKDNTVGDYKVYEEKADIKVMVRRAKGDSGPLNVSVQIQACSDKQCLLPSTIKLSVP